MTNPPKGHAYDVENPVLTKLGHMESEQFQHFFEPYNRITHIICSPLKRTLQTAVIAFKPLLRDGLKVVCWSDLRGFGSDPFHRSGSREKLLDFINGNPVEISPMDDMLSRNLSAPGIPTWAQASGRAERVKLALRELRDKMTEQEIPGYQDTLAHFGTRTSKVGNNIEVAVVGHSSLFRQLTNTQEKCRYPLSTYLRGLSNRSPP